MSKIQKGLDNFYGVSYYERADIKRTRKDKTCNVCNNIIPAGSSHQGYRFYGEDGDYPVFNVCNECAITEKDDLYLIEEVDR